MKVTFAIGDRIELMHIKSAIGRKVSDKKYGSQLLDFDGDRTAKIAMPISEGKVIPLEIDDDYNLCFFTNSGLYQCTARIKKRYTENRMCDGCYLFDTIEKVSEEKVLSFGLFVPNSLPDCSKRAV